MSHTSEVSMMKQGLMRKMAAYWLEDDIRVLNMLPGISCIANTDSYLVAVSDSFCAITGWTRDELLMYDIWFFIHPDDHEKTKQVYASQQKGHDVIEFENRWLKKDGSYMTLLWNASQAEDDGYIRAKAIIQ